MEKVIDPVCGMSMMPEKAAGKVERENRTWYFCTDACRQQFVADPERYLPPDTKAS